MREKFFPWDLATVRHACRLLKQADLPKNKPLPISVSPQTHKNLILALKIEQMKKSSVPLEERFSAVLLTRLENSAQDTEGLLTFEMNRRETYFLLSCLSWSIAQENQGAFLELERKYKQANYARGGNISGARGRG